MVSSLFEICRHGQLVKGLTVTRNRLPRIVRIHTRWERELNFKMNSTFLSAINVSVQLKTFHVWNRTQLLEWLLEMAMGSLLVEAECWNEEEFLNIFILTLSFLVFFFFYLMCFFPSSVFCAVASAASPLIPTVKVGDIVSQLRFSCIPVRPMRLKEIVCSSKPNIPALSHIHNTANSNHVEWEFLIQNY